MFGLITTWHMFRQMIPLVHNSWGEKLITAVRSMSWLLKSESVSACAFPISTSLQFLKLISSILFYLFIYQDRLRANPLKDEVIHPVMSMPMGQSFVFRFLSSITLWFIVVLLSCTIPESWWLIDYKKADFFFCFMSRMFKQFREFNIFTSDVVTTSFFVRSVDI